MICTLIDVAGDEISIEPGEADGVATGFAHVTFTQVETEDELCMLLDDRMVEDFIAALRYALHVSVRTG